MKTTFSCDTPKEMIRAIRAVNALYEGDTKTIMEIGITESPSYSGTLHDALTTLQVRVVNTEWLTKAWVLWMDFGLRYWTQKLIAENDKGKTAMDFVYGRDHEAMSFRMFNTFLNNSYLGSDYPRICDDVLDFMNTLWDRTNDTCGIHNHIVSLIVYRTQTHLAPIVVVDQTARNFFYDKYEIPQPMRR